VGSLAYESQQFKRGAEGRAIEGAGLQIAWAVNGAVSDGPAFSFAADNPSLVQKSPVRCRSRRATCVHKDVAVKSRRRCRATGAGGGEAPAPAGHGTGIQIAADPIGDQHFSTCSA
jgi:hypothetical protein